jgi:dihydrofolate reductase
MRRVFLQMMVSLDGYIEGPKKELDWHVWDDEMEKFGHEMLESIDTILLGRITYQLFADYWPSAKDSITPQMNNLPKIVFSRSLKRADWQNTRIISENVTEEISKLKHQSGKDLAIFGSSNLALTLLQNNLIDEYRIVVNPVILGNGKPLFEGLNNRFNLKLQKTKTFGNGNVLLQYEPDSKMRNVS